MSYAPFLNLLAVASLLSLPTLFCLAADAASEPAPFRIMTFNIHHGAGLDGKVDLNRIADLIRVQQADIIALQEVDKGVERTKRRDLPAELAELTGMSCLFSNNHSFQGGEYGNAILTRFPVRSCTNTLMPRLTPGEQRGILRAVLEVRGRELVIMATHLDATSETERLRNATNVLHLARSDRTAPILLCGDFNAVPDSLPYNKIAEDFLDTWLLAGTGDANTSPASKPRRRIDFLWLSKSGAQSLRPLRAWVPTSEASDHLPVVAEFQFQQ